MTAPAERADQLAEIAAELAVRIRDEAPEANLAWLTKQIPAPGDWRDLCFVLAAAIPTDRPWTELTAWTQRLDGAGRATPAPEKPRPKAFLLRDFNHAMATMVAIYRSQDISAPQIAALTKVTTRQIFHWLKGTHEPGTSRFIQLIQALGYDLALIPRQPKETR